MRNFIVFGLIFLLLALNCEATDPVQLSGISGQTILIQVASKNITHQLTAASPGDLWNWGRIPMNYALNDSGRLFELPSIDEDNTWLEARMGEVELSTTEYI